MKTRNKCSLLLALVLALAMTVPALASEELLPGPEEPAALEIPQGVSPFPTEEFLQSAEPAYSDVLPAEELINVAVPSVGEVILNPYLLPVEINGREENAQVIHQAQPLINYSTFPVMVHVTATGSVWDARFVEFPPVSGSGMKEVFLYAEFQNDSENWLGFYQGLPNQLPVTEYGTSRQNALTLDAGETGYFRLFGEMSTHVQPWWSSDNALSVTLAYSFERLPAVEPDAVDVFDIMAGVGEQLPPTIPSETGTIPPETDPVFPEALPVTPEAVPEELESDPDVPEVVPAVPGVLPETPELTPEATEELPDMPNALPETPADMPEGPETVPSAE